MPSYWDSTAHVWKTFFITMLLDLSRRVRKILVHNMGGIWESASSFSVTLHVPFNTEIEKKLSEKAGCPILSLEDILYEV